jgi:hypothetical protein
MSPVKVRPVDPRDQEWGLERPDYRVYFYDSRGKSSEYEVSEADVIEILEWADAQKGDRTYVLYVVVPGDGPGLVRLVGEDPNDPRHLAR